MAKKVRNKEVIKNLTEYFMKQPQDHTCKMLACMFIDLNRIVNYKQLDKEQLDNLQWRVQWNIDQLNAFIKNGPSSDLKLENMDSSDE